MELNDHEDLVVARYLAECGVPIFLAKPSQDFPNGGSDGKGYFIPRGWQSTVADPNVLDDWEPGMAVCAVMGHVVDGIDKDPRAGGDLPTELQPRVYGRQNTPSGGTHDLVAPLGVRSRDGIFGGIDVKAGDDGKGHGFLFIAPTVRPNHEGQVASYTWETVPALDQLVLVGGDDSGFDLAQVIHQSRSSQNSGIASYEGLPYEQLSASDQHMAQAHLSEKLEYWQIQLDEATDWPEEYRDHKGRGWEALTRDFAWALASYAVTPWMPLSEDKAHDKFDEMVPEVIGKDPKCRNKWYDGLLEKAGARPIDLPPWTDFSPIEPKVSKTQNLPESLDEYGVAEWLVKSGLNSELTYSPALGWLMWDDRRWEPVTDDAIKKRVIRAVKMANIRAIDTGLDRNVIKKLNNYMTESKTKALTALVRALTVDEGPGYDTRSDLLNVANGVINLRTGELMPHDPKYMFTKISKIEYHPDAKDSDWDQVLAALDPEVMDWMQIRFGQAATGYATPDAVLPIGIGGGSNGKTTLITAIRNAMGDFQTTVPDKLILGSPNDHSTEKTALMGARMAFIDETPEGRHLNVGLIKTLLGTSEMSARKIAKDPITWKPTHSMFLMTNHLPQVAENDHGTTRRFALVRFNKRFKRDDAFYARVVEADGPVATAALTWIVQGAKRWYANNKSIPNMPARVQADTDEWFQESDPTNEYIEDRFVLDPNSAILVKEVNEDINTWLMMNSMKTWSKNLTSSRLPNSASFKNQGIKPVQADRSKKLIEQLDLKFDTEVPSKARIYRGLRWRKTGEPMGFDPTLVHTPEFAEDLI